jgi:hypothetical protein
MNPTPPLIIGIAINPHNNKQRQPLANYVHPNIQIKNINIDIPLIQQTPFDILCLKLTDLQIESTEHSKQILQDITNYVSTNSQITMLEPFHYVDQLLNRMSIHSILSTKPIQLSNAHVYSPHSIYVQHYNEIPIRFPYPCIIKHMSSCGSKQSHQMYSIPKQ